MSSHALAIGLSAFAYTAARRYALDRRFAFGTWKIEVLAGFASAMFLLGIAAYMVMASLERLVNPQPIGFSEAIVVAVLGLIVNLVCAAILGGVHRHDHDEHHPQGAAHHHHDLNLKSAYLHVVADAATSVFAIVALSGGMLFGWIWLDPVMGIAGAVLVALWAWGLTRETSVVLLDRGMDRPIVEEVRRAIEDAWSATTHIADLHVWRVGRRRYACIVSLVTDDSSLTPLVVRRALEPLGELAHLTVEINRGAT